MNTHIISPRGEVLVPKNNVVTAIATDVNEGAHLQRQTARRVTPEFERAAETIDDLVDHLAEVHARMLKSMDALASGAKEASRKARSSATDMSALLEKINRGANYDRLQKNVEVLERIAAAMTTLADLEKSGHLARVMKALQ